MVDTSVMSYTGFNLIATYLQKSMDKEAIIKSSHPQKFSLAESFEHLTCVAYGTLHDML